MTSPDVGGFPFIPAVIRLKTHSSNRENQSGSGGRVITLAVGMSLSWGKNNYNLILSTPTEQSGTVHEDTFSTKFLLSHNTKSRTLNQICSFFFFRIRGPFVCFRCTIFCILSSWPENDCYFYPSVTSDATPQLSHNLHRGHRSGPLCWCRILPCFSG